MTRLVGLELLKLRRRWLIWILLGLLVAGEALTIFGGYYLAVSGTMTFLDERGQILPIEMVLPNFILPGALRAVLGLTAGWQLASGYSNCRGHWDGRGVWYAAPDLN